MTDLFVIILALTLLATIIGMIVKMYLENTEQERQYKKMLRRLGINVRNLKNVKENSLKITSWIRSERYAKENDDV